MVKLAYKISRILPESNLKTYLKCFYSNYISKNNFKVKFRKGIYYIKFKNGIKFKTIDNPFEGLYGIKPYFHYYKPKKGDVIIDAGAFNGIISIYCSKIVGNEGKIIAYEPDTSTFKKLNKNLEINKISNVTTINKGIWKEDTILFFSNDSTAGSKILNEKTPNSISIEVVKLDDEMKRLKLDKINFIKMDIEGAEIEAIDGMKKILSLGTHLSIASYHIINGEKTYKEVERKLKENNYFVKTLDLNQLLTFARKNE